MKNFVAIVLAAFMLVSLAACEQTESSSPSSTLESADSVQSETKRSVVWTTANQSS